jgi:peptidyl-prolyl cis-trans isomerase C
MNKTPMTAITTCLFAISLCGLVQAANNQPVIAVVNGDSIYLDRLETELARIHAGQGQVRRGEFDIDKLVTRMVNEQLMIQEARLMDLDQDPGFLNDVAGFQSRMAVTQLLKVALPDTYTVSDKEIRNFFLEQYPQYHFEILTVRTKDQADSLYSAIAKGAKFEDEARQYSIDMYRYRGGDLGFIRWIDLEDDLKDQATDIKVGNLRGPFEYRGAYSLLKLIDEKPADPEELEPYRKKVVDILTFRKRRDAWARYIDSLKKIYPVRVNEDAVHALSQDLKTQTTDSSKSKVVMAEAAGEKITGSDLIGRIMRTGQMGNKQAMSTITTEALNELINERLLQHKAADVGLLNDPDVLSNTDAFRDSVLVLEYLDNVVKPMIEIPASEVDSFYQANRDKYRGPGHVKISQLTVDTEAQADSLAARLAEGANFSWLAEKYSIDQYASKGGDAGIVSVSPYPDKVRQELETSEVGQIIGPFQSMTGFELVKLREKIPGEILDFSKMEERIKSYLFQEAFNRTLDGILERLRSHSDITINHDVVNNLLISGGKGE